MGPIHAIRTCLRKPFGFSGRATRAEYWWFVLSLVLGFVLALVIDRVVFTRTLIDTVTNTRLGTSSSWPVTKFWVLVSLVLGIAPAVRRLHDVSRPGWLILIVPPAFLFLAWTFILSVSSAMSSMPKSTLVKFADIAFPVAGLLFLASVLIVLIPLLAPSTPAENRFGPAPSKEPAL